MQKRDGEKLEKKRNSATPISYRREGGGKSDA